MTVAPPVLPKSVVAAMLAAALALGLVACDARRAPGAARAGEGAVAATAAEGGADGARLYADHCAACHGVSGGGRLGPQLAGNDNLARSDYLLAIVLRGGDGMPAFHRRLSEEQVVAVTRYAAGAWRNDFTGPDRESLESQWWGSDAHVATLFARACSRCHGEEGGGGIGPALAGNDSLGDSQYVAGKILHGQGGMPAFERLLDPERVAELASFVRSEFGEEFESVDQDTVDALLAFPGEPRRPEDRQTGKSATVTNLEEYLHSCALCHGPEGRGGVGPALAGNDRLGDLGFVLERVLHGFAPMPAFAERLSDAQVAAIVTHERVAWGDRLGPVGPQAVAAQRAVGADPAEEAPGGGVDAPPGDELYAEHCAICHGARGGGGVGPGLRGNRELKHAGTVVSRLVMGGNGMPPFGAVLSDAELAAVAGFIRRAWGNEFGGVERSRAADYHAQGQEQ